MVDQPIFATFQCDACQAKHNAPERDVSCFKLPDGWGFGPTFSGSELLCPDCVKPFRSAFVTPPSQPPSFDSATMGDDEMFGPLPFADEALAFEGIGLHGLMAHLERSGWDGAWRIALSPGDVMTRHAPLAFLLSPDEAERTGELLIRLAHMARNPGTLGEGA